ncbi:hypothetical protein ACFONG_04745 [Uliginosibacterium paludis]|uniref:YHYH domain-containing protein n=1 Tax=Uliginosibacterium paludis TaxID=1615952 RepID=A0ABV2CN74_9RHOO
MRTLLRFAIWLIAGFIISHVHAGEMMNEPQRAGMNETCNGTSIFAQGADGGDSGDGYHVHGVEKHW